MTDLTVPTDETDETVETIDTQKSTEDDNVT